jgi:hypothetical protein
MSFDVTGAVLAVAFLALVLWAVATVVRNRRNGGDAYKQEVESRRLSREATRYVPKPRG